MSRYPQPSTSPSSSRSVAATNPKENAQPVLKCFCGCTELTIDQIESFALMNVSRLLKNTLGNRLFKTFLKIGHQNDKSGAQIAVECYELCDKMLAHPGHYRSYLDELIEVSPDYLWEERLVETLEQTNSDVKFPALLKELKNECLSTIECHRDYDRFREELLRKIGKPHKD